ncbi:1-acyl-sn-glycerol-3-phosphate acyltransferase [Methyloversatilis sp. XJ19-49]|uniref:lysophospholipid acyltransferase family protein n=1 Tax=Methyloversatilis sp. XJ19-49 TaxID=2963429 RepID=UPI00211CF759|nr:lysophospholipid acyltransferase family protein [Methyloversatilis sp. XJ19-49]MCQ9377091.1 1-acyl-sn-glycerol-3-phosphate acyltransferase [Methyloversatilis sp. XJ19-49]
MSLIDISADFFDASALTFESPPARQPVSNASDRGLRAGLRMSWRISRLAVHLADGCARVALIYPLVSARTQRKIKAQWSRRLLRVLGVELQAGGPLPRPGQLLVSNHISWVDVFVINAISPLGFVCKDEIRSWPVLGWLVARNETVFIRRTSRNSAAEVRNTLVSALSCGRSVMVFPEGTTTDGRSVLPFRAAMFQAAIDAGRAVKPVRLRYLDAHGELSEAALYIGDTTFWQSVCRLARAPRTVAQVELLPSLPTHGHTRQHLARTTHATVSGLEAPAADNDPAEPAH